MFSITGIIADHPLWLAAYQNHPPTQLPGGWEHMSMWQHSETGEVDGINAPVDLNIFNGTHEQFGRFLQGQQFSPSGHRLPPADPEGGDLLTRSNVELVGAVLAVAGGVLAADQLGDVANETGLVPGDAGHLLDLVTQLADSGDLPVADLRRMVESGEYTIGDLILLLENTVQPGV